MAGMIEAPIDSGEVKILYPCSALSKIEVENKKFETITFLEKDKSQLSEQGFILRHRLKENGEENLTLKFRPKNTTSIKIDEKIFNELLLSSHGELKCEADVSYHAIKPRFVYSCSFKAMGKHLTQEHEDFLTMLNKKLPPLEELRSVKVRATKWKLLKTDKNLFTKRPSLEMWEFRNHCILEASAKFNHLENARKALISLKNLIPASPSLVQGNKTSRVLQ